MHAEDKTATTTVAPRRKGVTLLSPRKITTKAQLLKPLVSWTLFWNILGIFAGMAVVAIAPCLATWPLLIPTKYSLQSTQQIINFLVVGFATAFSILFRYCLSVTNAAECAADLAKARLTPIMLKTRSSASKQSHWELFRDFWRYPPARALSAFYLISLSLFGAVTWILSSTFIIEVVPMGQHFFGSEYFYHLDYATKDNFTNAWYDPLSPGIRGVFTDVRLGSGIPDGDDQCAKYAHSENCTYDLAISALSSQLITRTHYDYGFTQFLPPWGTRGLPYDVLLGTTTTPNRSDVESSLPVAVFDFCLPVLSPQTVYCNHDKSNKRVNYSSEIVSGNQKLVSVTINPDTFPDTRLRFDNINGTMTIAQSLDPSETNNTIITASGIYADLLSILTYGENSSSEIFTTVCTIQTHSTWQWVTFRSERGANNAEFVDEYCSNGYPEGYGFKDLYHAIEGATRLLRDLDGYCKLFNTGFNVLTNTESDFHFNYAAVYNMTRLEVILSQIYEIVQTSYSSTAGDDAIATPVKQLIHEHRYRIWLSWTAITDLAMVAASLLLLMICWQTVRWVRAVFATQQSRQWNLMEPLNLMGYSVLAAGDLKEHFEDNTQKDLAIGIETLKLGADGVFRQ